MRPSVGTSTAACPEVQATEEQNKLQCALLLGIWLAVMPGADGLRGLYRGTCMPLALGSLACTKNWLSLGLWW